MECVLGSHEEALDYIDQRRRLQHPSLLAVCLVDCTRTRKVISACPVAAKILRRVHASRWRSGTNKVSERHLTTRDFAWQLLARSSCVENLTWEDVVCMAQMRKSLLDHERSSQTAHHRHKHARTGPHGGCSIYCRSIRRMYGEETCRER
jgi:hypothetical protein